jgi:hypothetical protein
MPYDVENIDRLTLPAAPSDLLELTHLGAKFEDKGSKSSKKPTDNTDEDTQENSEGDREE